MPVDKIALQTARMREWCQFVYLIASGNAATQEVCFLWVSVPKSLQNFVFFSLPAGSDPPAPFVPLVPFGALEKRTTPARELHF